MMKLYFGLFFVRLMISNVSTNSCSRWKRQIQYDNIIVDGNIPYSVKSAGECAKMCTDTCIALSYSTELEQCHVYMEHPDVEHLETKASMSLYLLEGVDNFISSTPTSSTPISPTPTSVCPVPDQFLDVTLSPSQNFTIMITKDKQSQDDALSQCVNHGATLVRINTSEKMLYLQHVLTNCLGFTGSDYWTEGTNIEAANKGDPNGWIFTDLSNMPMGTTYWKTGIPNGNSDENCVRLTEKQDYMLNDGKCSAPYGYICEI